MPHRNAIAFFSTPTLNRQSKVKFMESNKRKKHQDIYSTDHSEKIYTLPNTQIMLRKNENVTEDVKKKNFALL